jgi:predicted transcriptional regulator
MPNLIIPEDGMNEKQSQAVELYCLGKKENEICEEVGITKPTLKRWLATNQHFRAMVRQYMSATMTLSNVRVSSLYEQNIEMVEDLMANRDELDTSEKLNLIKTVNSMVRSAHDMEKTSADVIITDTETTIKNEKGKVLSIEEQRNVIKRIRGEL